MKESDIIDIEIGKELESLRKRKKLTMQEVGDRIGVSRSMVHYYEIGKHSVSIPTLIKLCDIYDSNYIIVLEKVKHLVYDNGRQN